MARARRLEPDADNPMCPAPFHGDENAYHNAVPGCRCPSAREAWRLYGKRGREGRRPPRKVPSLGYTRRLKSMQAMGYSMTDQAELSGMPYDTLRGIVRGDARELTVETAAGIRAFFDTYRDIPGTSKYARTTAAKNGSVPPSDWLDDEWDDPDADPGAPPPIEAGYVDDVAVEEACAGRRAWELLTVPERDAAVTRLTGHMTTLVIAERLQTTDRAVYRSRERMAAQRAAAQRPAEVLELHQPQSVVDDKAA